MFAKWWHKKVEVTRKFINHGFWTHNGNWLKQSSFTNMHFTSERQKSIRFTVFEKSLKMNKKSGMISLEINILNLLVETVY